MWQGPGALFIAALTPTPCQERPLTVEDEAVAAEAGRIVAAVAGRAAAVAAGRAEAAVVGRAVATVVEWAAAAVGQLAVLVVAGLVVAIKVACTGQTVRPHSCYLLRSVFALYLR